MCQGGGGIIFHSLTLSAMHRSTCIRIVKTIEFDLAAKSQHPNKKKGKKIVFAIVKYLIILQWVHYQSM